MLTILTLRMHQKILMSCGHPGHVTQATLNNGLILIAEVLTLSKLNACSLGLGTKSRYYLIAQTFALMAIQ